MECVLSVLLIMCFWQLGPNYAGKVYATAPAITDYSGLLSDFLQTNYYHKDLNVSTLCRDELNLALMGLTTKDVWAIKLLDASGHVGSGFVWGNNYWLGSQKACLRINKPIRVTLSPHLSKNHLENLTEIASPIPVGYKLIWAKHQSRWQLDINTFDKTMAHIGLCLPQSCSDTDVYLLANAMLNSIKFGQRYIFNESFLVIKSKSLQPRSDFYGTTIVYAFLYMLFSNVILVTIGSIYSRMHRPRLSESQQKLKDIAEESKETDNTSVEDGKTVKFKRSSKATFIDRFFSCFCLCKNTSIITSNSLGRDSIESIHGMRALGMVWIISGHIFFYGPGAIDNLQIIFTYAELWYLQPLFAVAMSVDTYFVISGLVLSYLFFQTEKRKKKESAILKFLSSVVNRYLRLTPPYLVVIALTGYVSIYLRDTSPYWMVEANDANCPQYWWRNVLYIQNLYPMGEMCMSWSWYLAADFQCFVLSSFLLVVYTKLPKLAVTLFGVIFVLANAFTGYLGYMLSYSLSLDAQYSTIDYLYTPTYTRIGAYFIGVYAGWFLSHYERKLNIRNKYLIIGWILGPSLNLVMIFGTKNKDLSSLGAVLFTGLGKTAWSIGIAWMIIACSTGKGGIVNRILSAKCLLPYSRMSYTAYLINPLCIMYVAMSSEAPIHLDFLLLLIYCLGFQFMVFTLAYLFMLIFENPFIRLGKLLQGK